MNSPNQPWDLYFPGVDGVPFRSRNPPALKQNERSVEVCDVKIKVLDLSIEDDLKEYQRICDLVAKGLYYLSREEIMPNSEKNNWMVLVRYMERYAEPVGELHSRMKFDGQNITTNG